MKKVSKMFIHSKGRTHWEDYQLTDVVCECQFSTTVIAIDVFLNLNPRDLAHAFQLGLSIISIVAPKAICDYVEVLIDIVCLCQVDRY